MISNAQKARAAAEFIRQELPEALAATRQLRGLSLDKAGDEMGLSRSTLWRIENGRDVRQWCILVALEWMKRQEG